MATAGTSLVMKFGTQAGEKTWTFKYAKSNATAQQVKDLGQAMITNGSIYKNPPLSLASAQFVTTSITHINVD